VRRLSVVFTAATRVPSLDVQDLLVDDEGGRLTSTVGSELGDRWGLQVGPGLDGVGEMP
jgi:hypothetical protein